MTRGHILASLALALALTACSDGSGPSGNDASVDLFVGVENGGANAPADGAAGPLAAQTIELGGNTMVVTEVELVLRKLALQGESSGDACSDESEEAEETDTEDEADDDDDCSVLRMGPILVSLPLDGTTDHLFTIDAEAGTFRRMMFQLHKPSNAGDDAAFLVLHPEFANASVRVVGTFNAVPFEFVTDLTVVEHTELDPPLVLVSDGSTDLTLRVDISTWFQDQAGTGLIDPATILGSGQLDALVRQNIRTSFRTHPGDGTT